MTNSRRNTPPRTSTPRGDRLVMPPTNFGATKRQITVRMRGSDKAIKFSIGTTMSQYTTVEEMLIKKKERIVRAKIEAAEAAAEEPAKRADRLELEWVSSYGIDRDDDKVRFACLKIVEHRWFTRLILFFGHLFVVFARARVRPGLAQGEHRGGDVRRVSGYFLHRHLRAGDVSEDYRVHVQVRPQGVHERRLEQPSTCSSSSRRS